MAEQFQQDPINVILGGAFFIVGFIVLLNYMWGKRIARAEAAQLDDRPSFLGWLLLAPISLAGRLLFGRPQEYEPAAPLAAPGRPQPSNAAAGRPQPPVAAALPEWWPAVVDHDAHIMLVGRSRSGKSTAACALMAERAEAGHDIIIIDPHELYNDWPLPAANNGRNFAQIGQAYAAVHAEFIRRFTVGPEPGRPHLSIFLDEFPAIAAEQRAVVGYFTQWLREGAKAGIQIVIMTQDPNVKTLGIEGEGAVRGNLMKLLLGEFAARVPGAESWRPAALEFDGNVRPVSVRGLLPLASRPVDPMAEWPISAALRAEHGDGRPAGYDHIGRDALADLFADRAAADYDRLADDAAEPATLYAAEWLDAAEQAAAADWLAVSELAGQPASGRAFARWLYARRGGRREDYKGDGSFNGQVATPLLAELRATMLAA